MNKLNIIPPQSLFFAPMEGITDEAFRKTILKLYPRWDYLATDFLRVPSAGKYPLKFLIKHFGEELSHSPEVKAKTLFQILTSHKSYTAQMVKDIASLEYPWLDINLGCPSNTVTNNGGGSSLLKDIKALASIVKLIRENFPGRVSAKVRTGFHHTDFFEESIRMLNDEGVELITVHGRTRDMMYKEPADWSYIAKAVTISQVPIIGNGDLWSVDDIQRMFNQTGCHGVMVARGALKTPWICDLYKNQGQQESDQERLLKLKVFLNSYRTELESEHISERGLLKQSKSVSRFMFSDLNETNLTRRKLLLAQSVQEFFHVLNGLEIIH